MGAYIKQIVLGEQPSVGTGINPTHYLFLFDGDRPTWSIGTFESGAMERGDGEQFSLVPRSPGFIDRDVLVLIAAIVLKDAGVRRVLRDHASSALQQGLVALDGFPEKALCDLDAAIATIQRWPRMYSVDLGGEENQFWPLATGASQG